MYGSDTDHDRGAERMSLPRYLEYKDSGVEWLGEVPEHWEVWKLSHAFDVIGSGTTPKSDNTAYYDGGETAWVNTGDLKDGELLNCEKRVTDLALAENSSLKIFPAGSLIIAMYGATIGKLAILGFPSTVNQACCVFVEGTRVQSMFLFYWFLGLRQQIISLATGGGQPNISQEILRGLRLACPSHVEQCAIAAFLDRETGKIDALIAEQQRLVQLLAEKRQAVISHAVTKGLNPNVPMKDSGIIWLGEVPAHWEVKRLRYVAELNPSKSEIAALDRETLVSFLPMDAIGDDGKLNLEREKPIAEVETGYTFFREGDVTVAKITPCFENGKGAVMRGLTQGIGFGTTELIVARPIASQTNSDYLHSLFTSIVFRKNGEGHMYGAGGQKRVPDDFVRNFEIAFPPLAEQLSIATFLDTETEKFDTLTAEANHAIELLKERRSVLVSAAVTGKIDVRSFFENNHH
jgi:restriction endonuclease S subunit